MQAPFKTPIQVADGGVLIAADAELIFRAESATPEELAFIVTACNAYEPMREALQTAAQLIEDAITRCASVKPSDDPYVVALGEIRAALAIDDATPIASSQETSTEDIPVCSKCGSEDVRADSYTRWSIEDQEFSEFVSDHGNYVCEDCGGECDIDWIKPSEVAA